MHGRKKLSHFNVFFLVQGQNLITIIRNDISLWELVSWKPSLPDLRFKIVLWFHYELGNLLPFALLYSGKISSHFGLINLWILHRFINKRIDGNKLISSGKILYFGKFCFQPLCIVSSVGVNNAEQYSSIWISNSWVTFRSLQLSFWKQVNDILNPAEKIHILNKCDISSVLPHSRILATWASNS